MTQSNEQRPNAALINREWFESAANVLSKEDLSRVCLCAIEYVLYGKDLPSKNSNVGIVCAMIKPSLDSDITKYGERCERNRINAQSKRNPVAPSRFQSLPLGANTTTTTNTTTNTTAISLRETQILPEIDREKWYIYGYFWSTGSKAITQECTAFWSYYESLGWKNNKGAAIVDKLACARMWRRQYETGPAPDGAQVWFQCCKASSTADYTIWNAYAGAERTESGVIIRMRCSSEFLQGLKSAVPTLEKDLAKALHSPSIAIETI